MSNEARFGKGWNVNVSKKSRPAQLEKLLDYLIDVFDHYDEDAPYSKSKVAEVREVVDEIKKRNAADDLLEAIENLDVIGLREINKELDDERCWYCGAKLENENFKWVTETEEYWGAPASYRHTAGYQCPVCGEKG